MHISRSLVTSIILIVTGFCAVAQTETLNREKWIKANLYFKQDAIDFITTAYKEFTPVIAKDNLATGIYKRTVKLKDCELIITTYSRTQESSWKVDHEFERNIVVIELDKVVLDGGDIKPSSAENANGLFGGHSFEHTHKMPSFSIYSPVINKDDVKYAKLHYEDHILWAYQFLVEQCKK